MSEERLIHLALALIIITIVAEHVIDISEYVNQEIPRLLNN